MNPLDETLLLVLADLERLRSPTMTDPVRFTTADLQALRRLA
jgi:hypothetical protein